MAKPANWHVLDNVDLESKTADCSICGPSVPLRLRVRDGVQKRYCASPLRPLTGSAKRRAKPGFVRCTASLAELAASLESQNGHCAICNEQLELFPDHDHTTGKLRAWLCRGCNLTIGHARENPATLRAAAGYLEAKA